MKRLLVLLVVSTLALACEKKETPAPAATPGPPPIVTIAEPEPTPGRPECIEGAREETAVGGGSGLHINCRECVGGKWKPCKD